MLEFIPIQAVLDSAYFPRALRQELDDNTILTHALDAYRLLNIYQKLEEATVIKELKNHSVGTLPEDIHTINIVTYVLPKNSTQNISYSNIGEHDLIPMRYIGNRKINMTLNDYNTSSCKVCYHPELNGCSETYSISIFKELTSSIKDGIICIDYLREAKDEQGNFLIIKDPNILRYLGLYATAMVWRDRQNVKEEASTNLFMQYLQMAEIALRKAKGVFIQRNIDLSLVDSISGTNTFNQRLMRSPSFVFNKKDS